MTLPRLPRLMVSAPSTGQGKTTVATGLMAALTAAGRAVSGHKVGPDYIDPGYHALACGRPGRNLDPHLVGEERVVPLLLHGARGADVAVVEGVMGLYDGRLGGDGFASTAHVAALTRTPVLVVLDVARLSRSAGAIVHGLATYDPTVEVVGVVLNRAGSDRNRTEIERSIRVPVVGALPHDDELAAPSRHLGLVPADERAESRRTIERLGEQVARHVDLDAVLELAAAAPALVGEAWEAAGALQGSGVSRRDFVPPRPPEGRDFVPPRPPEGRDFVPPRPPEGRDFVPPRPPGSPVVAVAGGRAFTFRYAETEELLRAAGCAVATFDPMTDPRLPDGTSGIYLGGGFPEVHARAIADNAPLRREIARAVADGVPTVAECAGLLYLAESLDGAAMVGAVPARAEMTPRLTLRYPAMTAASDNLLTRAGEAVTGHEFHRTHVTPQTGGRAAWTVDGVDVGFASDTLHASYLHTHWAGHPRLAARFAEAVHRRA